MLELLREQAVERGLIEENTQMSPETVFSLVRDMPYQRASSREPEVTLKEWRGTCSGKHYLLRALLQEMGLEARIVMCTHVFAKHNTKDFPENIRRHLGNGPVPDVHTFIRLKSGDGWMDVDATWPIGAKCLGLRVNEQFRQGISMELACEPKEIFEVPDSAEPQAFKEHLIQSHCGTQGEKRDRFIEELSRWLCEALPKT